MSPAKIVTGQDTHKMTVGLKVVERKAKTPDSKRKEKRVKP